MLLYGAAMNIKALKRSTRQDHNGNIIYEIYIPTLGNPFSDKKTVAIINQHYATEPYDIRVVFEHHAPTSAFTPVEVR
jgi:hypothetical protein